ncbi:hypothetical protein GQF03_14565 [Sneathiella chungangensis]|uniref:Uncharacterized protein n=1 Tax=Sneathiella chungangensis TaxID=1418234 RepID=A0A845MIC0_9PROT|nr:hypothetical protein [Sneathiella chungangensis]MZR23559.1 hypothetical protein [Sneathiella chungangensis]
MTGHKKFDEFITAWDSDGTGYFKVARIFLDETRDAKKLEAAAKKAARDIEAEVMYAWDLNKPKSDAWWLGWGGYDLEEDIPFFAAMAKPEVKDKIQAFDPKDNEFECSTLEEYKEMLFNAYDEELTAAELILGFKDWVQSLDGQAQNALLKDLKSWLKNANEK